MSNDCCGQWPDPSLHVEVGKVLPRLDRLNSLDEAYIQYFRPQFMCWTSSWTRKFSRS